MCILYSPILVANIVFRSFFDLLAVIKRLVAQSNNIPKPFVWTADPDKIIAAVRRGIKRQIQSTSFIPWPHMFEYTACGHRHSVTAGCIFGIYARGFV